MKLSIAVVVGCICMFSLMAVPVYAQEEVIAVPVGERQLFLDDYVIAELNNLTRTMHQPDKKGAVIRPDWSRGEIGGVILQTRSAPFWDPEAKLFKYWVHGYRESVDGLHWTKVPHEQNMRVGRVFYDPIDPDPARRYKAFSPSSLHVSPDGLTWTKLDVPPIPSSDESNFSFDEKGPLYIATVKHGGPYGRSVHLSTSTDFEHWTAPELIFHADELDQELGRKNIRARLADPTLQQPVFNDPADYNVDVYNMGVFRYEGLYIGMPTMFHWTGLVPQYNNHDGFYIVQLACSRDLHNWKRVGNRQPFIGPSRVESGAYDLTMIMPPSSAVVHGDELWFYYSGCKYRGLPRDFDPDRGAICLAVLRRDGFVSLDAGEEAGSIITKPLRIPEGAQRLFVNVDGVIDPGEAVVPAAGVDGELRVVIMNNSGQPLAGFGIDQCVPITADQVRTEVTWEGSPDLSALAGQEVQIRFRLRNASFYSFWFE